MHSDDDLVAEMEKMGPWHHRIEMRENIFTGSSVQEDPTGSPVTYIDTAQSFETSVAHVLPRGMEGRSFLDCACNCGGYSFAAKDRGASKVYGFDIRDHWIDQARFVQDHREADSSGMLFETADLLDLRDRDEKFDVTWFSGIFYHLHDPVAALKLAADNTNELLFLNTACMRQDEGGETQPGLVYKLEGTEQLMSGVYRLSWLPTGPKVLSGILAWLGFPETRVYHWVERPGENSQGRPFHARIALVGARETGRLEDVPTLRAPLMRPEKAGS
ncbi:MAG: class I SAM-dependent methyltransferase [Pseudomonadota bacterium]